MTSDELENFDGDSLLHSLLLVSKHFGINTNAESLTASTIENNLVYDF